METERRGAAESAPGRSLACSVDFFIATGCNRSQTAQSSYAALPPLARLPATDQLASDE